MYYCNMHRGMDLKLHEKHLKVAQDICDGHERCVLQAGNVCFLKTVPSAT